MGTHPNVILYAEFKPAKDQEPDSLYESLRAHSGTKDKNDNWGVTIRDADYTAYFMEDDYDEDFQLGSEAGNTVEVVPGSQLPWFASERREKRGLK